jgi:hypothetical protein
MKSNYTTPHQKAVKDNFSFQSDEWNVALLDEIVRENVRDLGASPNSPIHKAMLKLSREVWEFAKSQLK